MQNLGGEGGAFATFVDAQQERGTENQHAQRVGQISIFFKKKDHSGTAYDRPPQCSGQQNQHK